ncbi:putative ATP synthase subunit g 1, mitochondrial [Caenorhabditis elegans]|uniref:Probable ATP synthase subunit g 1, mitochondrial n=1 Tax=Caenorhabditis elegans TaxID=6239 RepID=ATPL1_CAEEL|nr:putative ATP synthase subunit g 1, mitochondrial [Caenorhabditis elegans]P90921.1 RecName: Full=Probable ATP synthase subunit g 1, mitochondrial; Short=ATPase subunit g 1 [Caenorhabditis elegans]CAB03179.1 Probable ATP synthase subunit g 1, mitochondrial [Caenorhabditis elegans]|eukprot:NP_492352.1 Probable ATP synthase subunit g 1, mitochondrial [Caenorhabditis elegans]
MATHKLSFFEKLANTFGALYRHQAQQFPRRLAILKAVGKHELAPPRSADIPAIKADWAKLQKFIETKQYVNLSIKESLVYSAVALEVVFWFFVGEMIGRRYIFGYIVPANYVSKDTKAKVAEKKRLAALEA